MGTSLEFLAAFEDWENACLSEQKRMDTFPGELKPGISTFESHTAHAELLKVLTAYDEVGNIAKDGKKDKSSKNGDDRNNIKGFPGLVVGSTCGGDEDWKEWKKLFLPTPENMRLLPDGSCLLEVGVTLQSPFFSRDDRPFYPTDNVLRRHHVFHTPCLSAAGLKGLLHWAWRMSGGSEEDAALLFGKEADGDEALSRQGLLYLWPVFWEGETGIEVINPQNRTSGAGTVPIKYEVVKAGGKGSLFLLLLNRENAAPRLMGPLVEALLYLLDHGGLSAKSSAGWGQVTFHVGRLYMKGAPKQEELKAAQAARADSDAAPALDKDAAWRALKGADGNLLPYSEKEYTKKRCMAALEIKAEKKYKDKLKNREAFMQEMRQKFEEWKKAGESPAPTPAPEEKADWQCVSSLRNNFESEVKKRVEEMGAWLK